MPTPFASATVSVHEIVNQSLPASLLLREIQRLADINVVQHRCDPHFPQDLNHPQHRINGNVGPG